MWPTFNEKALPVISPSLVSFRQSNTISASGQAVECQAATNVVKWTINFQPLCQDISFFSFLRFMTVRAERNKTPQLCDSKPFLMHMYFIGLCHLEVLWNFHVIKLLFFRLDIVKLLAPLSTYAQLAK